MTKNQSNGNDNNIKIFYLVLSVISVVAVMMIGTAKAGFIIEESQKHWTDKFSKISDMYRCPQTAEYLTDFQSGFETVPFPLMQCLITGSIVLVTLIGAKYSFNITNLSIYFIFLFTFLIMVSIFLGTYKILNCFVVRICGKRSCAVSMLKNKYKGIKDEGDDKEDKNDCGCNGGD